jgi:hypothetical protein
MDGGEIELIQNAADRTTKFPQKVQIFLDVLKAATDDNFGNLDGPFPF